MVKGSVLQNKETGKFVFVWVKSEDEYKRFLDGMNVLGFNHVYKDFIGFKSARKFVVEVLTWVRNTCVKEISEELFRMYCAVCYRVVSEIMQEYDLDFNDKDFDGTDLDRSAEMFIMMNNMYLYDNGKGENRIG